MGEPRYRWIMTTLTPVHIGSGDRLREGFDFIDFDGFLWFANQGALFRTVLEEALRVRKGDEAQIALEIAEMNLYQFVNNGWLRPEHFKTNPGIFSYRLAGKLSKKQNRGELFSHIKDIENRPYIPGSSLKGSLRSMVMRAIAHQDQQKPVYHPGNPKKAAFPMEQRYFAVPGSDAGQFPYFDLWRAFRMTDSTPLPTEGLTLAQAIIYRRPAQSQSSSDNPSIPLDLEVIPSQQNLEAHCWIDTWLLNDQRAARDMRFNADQKTWLTRRLVQRIREETAKILEAERNFYQAISQQGNPLPRGIGRSIKFLFDTFNELDDCEFMLTVGKGTGWLQKTLGHVLQEKLTDDEFRQIVKKFRLGRGMWNRTELIPYTRMLVSTDSQSIAPPGWIKIRVEEE
jgi:CRISPR-associated protein Csm5